MPIQSAPAIGYAAAVQIDHKILLFGGWNRNPVNSALVFDCQKGPFFSLSVHFEMTVN